MADTASGEVALGEDAPLFEVMQTMRAMRRLKPDRVPRELGHICNRAMAKDPEDRFPDVQAFQRAIEEFLEHRNVGRMIIDNENTIRHGHVSLPLCLPYATLLPDCRALP